MYIFNFSFYEVSLFDWICPTIIVTIFVTITSFSQKQEHQNQIQQIRKEFNSHLGIGFRNSNPTNPEPVRPETVLVKTTSEYFQSFFLFLHQHTVAHTRRAAVTVTVASSFASPTALTTVLRLCQRYVS